MTVRRGLHLGSDGCPMLGALPDLKAALFTRENVNEGRWIQEEVAQKTPGPLRPIATISKLKVVERLL